MPVITNNKLYDRIKFLAQIGLPALGALYFGLAGIWGLPEADKVVGTIAIFDTFLGVFLGFSSATYNNDPRRFDGTATVMHDEGQVRVQIDDDSIVDKDEVRLRVAK